MTMLEDLQEIVHRVNGQKRCSDIDASIFIRQYAAQIERDARDVERYRWLRDKSYGQFEHPICVAQLPQRLGSERVGITYIGPMIGEVLDQAIDAAIGAAK